MPTLPHFEPLTGTVDGVNTVFTTSTAYIAGATVLFLRGIPRRIDWDDGWFETNPATGVVTLKKPPLLDDDVQMLWLELVPVEVGTEVTPLSGIINSLEELFGRVQDRGSLSGCLSSISPLCATLQISQPVSGQISALTHIYGIIKD